MSEPDREYRSFEARVRGITRESVDPHFAVARYAGSTLAATAALAVLTTVPWIGGDRFVGGLRAWDLPALGVVGVVELGLVLVLVVGSFGLARGGALGPRWYRVLAAVAVPAVVIPVVVVVADTDLEATAGMDVSLVVMLVLAVEHAVRAAASAG